MDGRTGGTYRRRQTDGRMKRNGQKKDRWTKFSSQRSFLFKCLEQTNGQKDGRNRQTDGRERTDKWTDEQTDGWTNRTYGRTDRRTKFSSQSIFLFKCVEKQTDRRMKRTRRIDERTDRWTERKTYLRDPVSRTCYERNPIN